MKSVTSVRRGGEAVDTLATPPPINSPKPVAGTAAIRLQSH